MSESISLSYNQIKKKSVGSIITLFIRTIFIQIVSLVGTFFITIFLGRSEFGIFILVSTIIDILGYFSDIGLAAAIIQKKEKPSLKEIRATFTLQQILVLSILVVVFILSPWLKKIYHLNNEAMILLYSFSFAFFLSSLKTIPSVLLERKLEFNKIIIPQFVETIVFNSVVVILAWRGFGITCYSWAVLLRGLLGAGTLYLIAPWPIGWHFSLNELKKLLKFGIPYQLNTLLAVVKDKIMILILGVIIGSEGIGLSGWAEKWASMPLRYFLDNTIKVLFPAFSRIQHHPEKLKRVLEASLYFICILIFPSLAGICLVSPFVISLIPRLGKWQPALIALYLYAFSLAWGAISTLLTNALTAIGQIKLVFKLMIMWTILTWLTVPVMALKFGFVGVALASALISLSSFVPIILTKKYIKYNLLSNILPPLVASLAMILVILAINNFLPHNLFGLLLEIIIGLIIFSLAMLAVNKNKLFSEAKILLSYVKK